MPRRNAPPGRLATFVLAPTTCAACGDGVRPTLVALIGIDQFRAGYLDGYAELFT